MRNRNIAVTVFIAGLALAAARWPGSAAENQKGPRTDPAKAAARVQAAQKAYELGLEMRQHDPEAVDREHFYRWSVRWMEAERDAAQTEAERVTALARHLKRMQLAKEKMKELHDQGLVSTFDIASADYFYQEAEAWLTAEKAAR